MDAAAAASALAAGADVGARAGGGASALHSLAAGLKTPRQAAPGAAIAAALLQAGLQVRAPVGSGTLFINIKALSPHMRKRNHRAGWAKCTQKGLVRVSHSRYSFQSGRSLGEERGADLVPGLCSASSLALARPPVAMATRPPRQHVYESSAAAHCDLSASQVPVTMTLPAW